MLANKEFLLTLYLCSPGLALPLTVMRATSQFVHHLTVGDEGGKAKTQEGLTLEIELELFVGKDNINSWSQTDKSDNSTKQDPQHEQDS